MLVKASFNFLFFGLELIRDIGYAVHDADTQKTERCGEQTVQGIAYLCPPRRTCGTLCGPSMGGHAHHQKLRVSAKLATKMSHKNKSLS